MSPAALRTHRVKLAGRRQASLARARRRLVLAMGAFLCLTLVTTIRLVELGAGFGANARISYAAAVDIGQRAPIVDRNGADLARSFQAYFLAVQPRRVVGDRKELAAGIADILGERDPQDLERLLTRAGNWRYIQRRVQPEDAARLKALGEPGLIIEREWERVYPNRTLAAHTLGYANVDGVGQAGLERELDERLTDPARLEEPVQLSLDTRVQHALVQAISRQMDKHSAIGGGGVVLDVRTGEVLALTSQPVFDPNAAGAGTADARFNRATYGVYELGSTFKALTMAMALDSGTVTSMAQAYDATKPLKVGRFRIRDSHPENRWLTVPEIFMHSSNIGTSQIALEIGAERQKEYLRELGMLERPHIELAERGRPLYPDTWGEVSTMTISYGHGIAVTPLHIAAAYAALVNGGIYRDPTLLKVGADEMREGRRVFSQETSDRMRELLRLVVLEGTGSKADAEGYRVGGKTGTAEKPRAGGYARKSLVTNFAGVFPIDDPRYAVIVMLDEPQGIKETYGFAGAGWTAAPVVKEVVSRIAPILEVDPDPARDIDLSALLQHVHDRDAGG
ncbi:peptidoglycan glycosyltransferase [Pacificimonas flava]|uniref:Peptidoglycan glycosyltransferase n=2 Tax=Pacificimonas TaxID=1960290 RepID=A0A219B675_9SPHN|nr:MULTISPECIES: penicillin-binding protein 2 [Pacificimonas]MBZ6378911.1 penicillin-binding protein 2 [Pacificimonas aurantium]OWV33837.1 peptidoglycan glycosyltransferase [Pacificimonas flava]